MPTEYGQIAIGALTLLALILYQGPRALGPPSPAIRSPRASRGRRSERERRAARLMINLGYFTMPIHPPDRDYVQTLKEDREAILLADALGFTEAFVGEHVTDVAESVTDCAVFLASLAHLTKTIKLGTGTVNLPNGHPAAIAAKIAMLDNILEGRFVFGISPGGLPSDWEVFGNLDVDRREKFAECIDQILAIWAGDAPYQLQGKYWTVTTEKTQIPEIGQGLIVKPYQKPHPPIVVTVVEPSSKSAADAGARGFESSRPTSSCPSG